MPKPIISILHPTARVKPFPSFPRGWRGACEQFANNAVKPHQIEYVLIVHESRWSEFWEHFGGGPAPESDQVQACSATTDLWGSFLVIQNHGRDCVVDQINVGAAAASGDLFIGIMDDLTAPERWDEKLTGWFGTTLKPGSCDINGEWVIDLTGEPTEWIVYGAMTRKRYERYGYALHPEFESMFADNYFSHVAHKDGVVIDGRHLGFRHNHPSNGRTEVDEVYLQQNRAEAYACGRALFNKLVSGRQTLAVVMPGEIFSAAWVGNAFNLQWNLAESYDIQPHMGFSSVVHATRFDLHAEVLDATPKADLVLWFDDDNIPSYPHVERLLRDLEERPELDGVVGWCWCDNAKGAARKPEDWTMSVGLLGAVDEFGGHTGMRFSQTDLAQMGPLISARDIQAKYGPQFGFWSGFPLVLLRYQTMVRMGRDCFAPILHKHAKRGFTGEDASFFWNAHRVGVNMGVDLRVKVPHMKFGAFEPQFSTAPTVEQSQSEERAPAAVPVLV